MKVGTFYLIAAAAFAQAPAITTAVVVVRSQDVTPPSLLSKVEPTYTEDALKRGIEGKVLLYLEVGTDGKPINIRLLHHLDTGLDASAIAAVKQWLFKPATKDGEFVVCKAQAEVNFKLLTPPGNAVDAWEQQPKGKTSATDTAAGKIERKEDSPAPISKGKPSPQVLAEREACAKIAELLGAPEVAAAIRARRTHRQ